MRIRIKAWIFCAMLSLAPAAQHYATAANGDCGQPQSIGSGPKTTDALAALRKAVGSPSACDAKPCICDVNGDGFVTTSDALRILRAAVGQAVELTCDCEEQCVTLGSASLVSTPAEAALLDLPPQQVLLEVRIVGVNKTFAQQTGLSFALLAGMSTDAGPASGGTNGGGTTVAVDSNASGGPPGLQYLLYDTHRAEGCLPVLNKNFVSPFNGVKTFFPLPTTGCVLFDPGAFSLPQNFPGGNPVQNVPAADAGHGSDTVLYDLFNSKAASNLLAMIQNDNRNVVLTAPNAVVYSGQALLHMVDDIMPTLQQVTTDFRTRIQAVTPSPFGVFTGTTLDVTPQIDGASVKLDIRVGTHFVSFFYSTAFMVDGMQVDAEIPLHRRSRNVTTVSVPAGQTLVVGGLHRMGQQDPEIGLPVLGEVPLIGTLFTHKHLDPDKQNLIVFVAPTIIDQ